MFVLAHLLGVVTIVKTTIAAAMDCRDAHIMKMTKSPLATPFMKFQHAQVSQGGNKLLLALGGAIVKRFDLVSLLGKIPRPTPTNWV